MSYDYTTLQAALLTKSVRSDLAAETADFVRLAEGMIRRNVRAMETRTTIGESARIADGLYTLPDTIQEVRAVYGESGDDGNTFALENVGLLGIRAVPADADPTRYAISGGTIEFRGVPGTDVEFEIVGFGWPDPLETTSTNSLLTNHEAIYLYGALHHLWLRTQDFELAQSALSLFNDAVRQLNALTDRKVGGASILPAYNFGQVRIGRGY